MVKSGSKINSLQYNDFNFDSVSFVLLNNFISHICSKSEFKALPNDFVKRILVSVLKENNFSEKDFSVFISNSKSANFKKLTKLVRAKLRVVYGVFQKETNSKRFSLLKKGDVDSLLLSHTSTSERVSLYPEVFSKLFSASHVPSVILDLGCGFNPLAYDFLGCSPKYFASDLSKEDLQIVNHFFNEGDVDGSVFPCDLLDVDSRISLFKKASSSDMVFLFKLVDTLESQSWNSSKELLLDIKKLVNPKTVIVSFATKSIGGSSLRSKNVDNWFSRFLKSVSWSWEIVSFSNEEFWVINF